MEFEAEIRERLARIEQDNSSIHRRLNDLESIIKSIQDIAVELRELRVGQDAMKRTIDEMNERVEDVESRPKKRWDTLIASIITAAVTAIVTFVGVKITE